MKKNYIAVIRDRGQITIPDAVRDTLSWIQTNTPVVISVHDNHSLTIAPQATMRDVDWDAVMYGLTLSRSFAWKKDGSTAAELIESDRQSR